MVFGAPRRTVAGNMQLSGGLVRYRSAPSFKLASLIDEDFLPRDSSLFCQGEESEFTRFLSDNLGSSTILCDPSSTREADEAVKGMKEQQHSDENRVIERQSQCTGSTRGNDPTKDVNQSTLPAKTSPLRPIFEHVLDETLMQFCSPCTTVVCNQQAMQSGHQITTNSSLHDHLLSSGLEFTPAKSNLIRHGRTPADFLSTLVIEKSSEQPIPHVSGSYMQAIVNGTHEGISGGKKLPLESTGPSVASFTGKPDYDLPVGTRFLESFSEQNRTLLLRQSSSPAVLFSQSTHDAIPMVGEKVSMSFSSGNPCEESIFDIRGPAFVATYGSGGLDKVGTGTNIQNVGAFGQRKRGREIEIEMPQDLSVMDSRERCTLNHVSCGPDNLDITATTRSCSTVSMEMATVESVPWRPRAKRGCATHPRSIAERVRRTKISERMRRLQDLVPHVDKQTNTADMLDEAVEYVKFLQHQVQELSEKKPKCNGMCQELRKMSVQV